MNRIEDYSSLVWVFSFVGLWLSARIGAFFCRKQRNVEIKGEKDFSTIMSAILTLLSLIIGFSFSMAVNRYDQRKNCEEEEANSIGTEYARAGFLPAGDAARMRALLRNYLDQRILFYSARDNRRLQQNNATTAQLEIDLWAAVQTTATARSTPLVALAASGMNDVFNSRGYTQAAWLNRIPGEAWILMAVMAIFCNLMIGFSSPRAGVKGILLLVIPIVVSISFFFIADIDSSRHGIIRVSPVNLTSLSQSLR